MQVTSREQTGEGRERVTLVPESLDDLWHLSHVVEPGDRPATTDDAADGTDGEPAHEGTPSDGTDTAVDPVCGMDVTVDEDTPTVEHGGREYRFCGQGCADAFTGEPDRYAEVDTDA